MCKQIDIQQLLIRIIKVGLKQSRPTESLLTKQEY